MDMAVAKTAKNGKFKGDPVYHLILSWQEGDKPTPKQVKECVQYTLTALGMEECQAVWAIHHDTDNDHVHIAVNRVHPEKGIVMGPPGLPCHRQGDARTGTDSWFPAGQRPLGDSGYRERTADRPHVPEGTGRERLAQNMVMK